MRVELSIVMPCRNEAETLETCVAKARRYLDDSGVDGEIIVVDNGSTDGSAALARRLGVRVVEVPEQGYGAALMGGILAARGTFIVMGDADDSYDFSALEPFMTALRDGADLVMGDRFAGGIDDGAMPALNRYVGNPALSFLGRLFFHTDIRDFHCGLRGFRRDAILRLDLHSPGMEFASEMVVKASLGGMRIDQVPIRLHRDGRSRPPHLRAWRDGWRHLRFLLLYSPRWLFFYPGLLLLLDRRWVRCRADADRRDDRAGHVQHRHAGRVRGPRPHRLPVGLVRPAVQVLRQPRGPAAGRPAGDAVPSSVPARAVAGAVDRRRGGRGAALIAEAAGWDFQPLDPTRSMRVIIPSVTVLVLGLQTALCSLLLSILGLPSARPTAETVLEQRRDDVA